MIKIGITGGIGSGKSVVSRLMQMMGIPVYLSDDEAKRLTVNDPDIRTDLINLLGNEAYQGEALNKVLVANYLFKAPENTIKINNIIHPRVKNDFRNWAEQHTESPIVAIESAILIEAGFLEEVDKLIMVYAPIELRIDRVISRDNLTREEVLKRINNQMSDDEKKRMADYIILNDNNQPVIPQVNSILKKLSV